ncbi:MAG: S41 family peptidase [Vicinamibacterales bacterium]|jgi:C-terminal processing protease CtpA/Prc
MRRLAAAVFTTWCVGVALWGAQPASLAPGLIAPTVTGVVDVFSREYFDIPLTGAVRLALTSALAGGRYAKAATPQELAELLTHDLYDVTRDKHVAVQVVRPSSATGSSPAQRDVPTTAGFRRTEVLPGNIGLLDMAYFLRPVEHRDALAAAMKLLQPAAALILDMRNNGGGSPGTVALLMSYLFEEPGKPLFEVIPRTGTREVYATVADTLAWRDGKRPVFVLTSKNSFSGGEGLAFLLQDLKRAVVIGESTAGAANPGRPYPVNDLFEITVPNGQLLTILSRRNWEGNGVTPDIKVPATDALTEAHTRALAAIKQP